MMDHAWNVLQVYWCLSVETCLFAANVEAALAICLKQNIDQLEELSVLVRGDLLALDRKILTALITIDVHARDIIEDMLRFVTDCLISVQTPLPCEWNLLL